MEYWQTELKEMADELRKRRGRLTMAALAKATPMEPSSLSRWRAGKQEPTFAKWQALKQAYTRLLRS